METGIKHDTSWTETHLKENIKYQRQLDALPGDGMEMARIETLSKMLIMKH
jgi:hypothetical protein